MQKRKKKKQPKTLNQGKKDSNYGIEMQLRKGTGKLLGTITNILQLTLQGKPFPKALGEDMLQLFQKLLKREERVSVTNHSAINFECACMHV